METSPPASGDTPASKPAPVRRRPLGVSQVDDHRVTDEGECQYHTPLGDRWLGGHLIAHHAVAQYWLSRTGAEANPRTVLDRTPRRRKRPFQPKQESAIEILGISPSINGLQITIRTADGKTATHPTAEIKKHYPMQLSTFYEQHIKFT
jgi:hypothetical protein